MKHGLIALIAAVVVSTCWLSTASASSRHVQVATGSCPSPSVPAVVNATFMCLNLGGPCSVKFQQDYVKFQLSCAAGKLIKLSSAAGAGPAIAEAFLNTSSNDLKTRATTFTVSGPTPVLHLTFRQALKGAHSVRIDVHNPNLDQTINFTLQNGWQFTYEKLPETSANAVAGAYRVTISIDGAQRKQLYYSVKQ
jgi:hypothetical protein